MTPNERILCAMRGEEPDRVPLTVYDWMLPRGRTERALREEGVGLVVRLPAHRVEHREVEILTRDYRDAGGRLTRRTIRTPVGEVWQTLRPEGAYGTSSWIVEHFIKRPEDYGVMERYYRDMVFRDNAEAIREARRRMGSDGIVIVRVAKSPIQEMLYQMMGLERFAVDWHERRDLFDSLHRVVAERQEELYDLAAASPVEILQLGDNVSSHVVGRERYRTYLMPEYEKLHRRIAGSGKLLAVHMDGLVADLKEEVGESSLDIVEALTPPPMGDLSVREARSSWPGKALWINFTSSLLIASGAAVAAHTRELLREAGTARGFAVSVTEDAPVEALERSLGVIAGVLREAGRF